LPGSAGSKVYKYKVELLKFGVAEYPRTQVGGSLLILIILAYNEEKNIGTLLENILALAYKANSYHVIVVDDGSSDDTVNIINSFTSRMPVEVISHPVNRGVGAAFQTGFGVALKKAQPTDVIVSIEADNTSDLGILPLMINKVENGNDLVLASCYADEGQVKGTNLWRKFLSLGANLLLGLVFSLHGIKTYSSFYRAYNAGALRSAFEAYQGKLIEQPGFVCMVEVLVKMQRLGLQISEVPMILQIGLRKGPSKMRIWRNIREYINFIWTDIRQRNQRSQ
jgi:dolichol-phosphate mannosyltransferase